MTEEVQVRDRNTGEVVLRYTIGKSLSYKFPWGQRWWTIGKLFRDRLIVRMDRKTEKTAGGRLWIPDQARRRPMIGQVILKGDGTWIDYEDQIVDMNDFTPGERIMFRPVSGMPICFGLDQEVWHFRAGSILATVTGDTESEEYTGIAYPGNEESEYPELESGQEETPYTEETMGVE